MLYEKNVETKNGTDMFREFGWHLRRLSLSLSSVWRWQERIVEVPQAMGVEVAVQVPKAHLPNSSRFCAAKHRKKTIAARCTSENSKQLKIWYLLQSKSVLLFCWNIESSMFRFAELSSTFWGAICRSPQGISQSRPGATGDGLFVQKIERKYHTRTKKRTINFVLQTQHP